MDKRIAMNWELVGRKQMLYTLEYYQITFLETLKNAVTPTDITADNRIFYYVTIPFAIKGKVTVFLMQEVTCSETSK
jgi:hypothetical protein